MDPVEVERNIAHVAQTMGVSEAKLRAIYMRGVRESMAEGYDGPTVLHGLARMQRFALAYQTSNPRMTPDSDFFTKDNELTDESNPLHLEEFEAAELVLDTVSAQGLAVQSIFPKNSVTSTVFDTDTRELTVCGEDWSCVFNVATGETKIQTQS